MGVAGSRRLPSPGRRDERHRQAVVLVVLVVRLNAVVAAVRVSQRMNVALARA